VDLPGGGRNNRGGGRAGRRLPVSPVPGTPLPGDLYLPAMGLFRRRRHDAAAVTTPPERGSCACPEHVEELADLEVPLAERWAEDLGESMTVGELVEMGALGVDPPELVWVVDHETRERRGPFHFALWLGDEVRATYDDDAVLQVDESLASRPGIEIVDWEDREVFQVSCPTLCADGLLAAAARALLDPRVRQLPDPSP
jgi:hypothetical protein